MQADSEPCVLISTVDMHDDPALFRRVPLSVARCSGVLRNMLDDIGEAIDAAQPPVLPLADQGPIYSTRTVELDRIIEHTTRYLADYQDPAKLRSVESYTQYDDWEERWISAMPRRDRLLLLWAANYLELPNLMVAASGLVNNEQAEFLMQYREAHPEVVTGTAAEVQAWKERDIYEQWRQSHVWWGTEDEIDFSEADAPRLLKEYEAELAKANGPLVQ